MCVAVWLCHCVSLCVTVGVPQGVSLYVVVCVTVCVSLRGQSVSLDGSLYCVTGDIIYVKSIDLGLAEILDASQTTSNRPEWAPDTAESNDYTWVVTMGELTSDLARL